MKAGSIQVQLSNNNQEFTNTVGFEFYATMVIQYLSPIFSSNESWTSVMIKGKNLRRDIKLGCYFLEIGSSSSVKFVNSTHGECNAPLVRQKMKQKMTIQVREILSMEMLIEMPAQIDAPPKPIGIHRLNTFPFGIPFVTEQTKSTPQHICFGSKQVVSSIRPESGLAQGGTRVLVIGSHFTSQTTYQCKFGRRTVTATYLSSTQLICIAPPSKQTSVRFDLIEDNAMITTDIQEITFIYQSTPIISSLEPSRGSVLGQYKIFVHGSFFVNSVALRCRVGISDVAPVEWISDSIVMCTMPSHVPGLVDVSITNNMQDFSRENIQFEYVTSPVVLSFSPSEFSPSVDSGNVLHINGRHFQNSSGLRCIFGTEMTRAVFISTYSVNCFVPPARETIVNVGIIDINVKMTAVFASSPLYFREPDIWRTNSTPLSNILDRHHLTKPSNAAEIIEDATLSTIFPSSGPISQVTLVQITGTNFKRSKESSCFFGGFQVPAVVVSSGEATCIVNPSNWASIGISSVRFSSNGQERSQDSLKFHFYSLPEVMALFPSSGRVGGGTLLTLTTDSPIYMNDTFMNISVVIDGKAVSAKMASSTQIQFETPSTLGSRAAHVLLSLNGQHFEKGPSFWYLNDPIVQSLQPSRERESGGSLIYVYGMNFPRVASLKCYFGSDDAVPADWISETLVICKAPKHSVGVTRFSFSTNGVEVVDSGLTFTYIATTGITAKYSPVSGPTSGGTVLDIELLSEFQSCRQLFCAIGTIDVAATILSDSTFQCITPASKYPQIVSIEITCQSKTLMVLYPGFAFFEPPKIHSFAPRAITPGSSTRVSVRGKNFAANFPMVCRFDGTINTAVLYVNSDEIQCPIPILVRPKFYDVDLEISMNGFDFTDSGAAIQLLAALEVLDVKPRHLFVGYSYTLTVIVSELINLDLIKCRLGERFSGTPVWKSNSRLECIIPIIDKPGQFAVSVSANGVDFTYSDTVVVSYHATPSLLRMDRHFGSESGGEIVTISGQNFAFEYSLFCSFDSFDVPATVLSRTSIACVAPPFSKLYASSQIGKSLIVRVGFRAGINRITLNTNSESEFYWLYHRVARAIELYPSSIYATTTSIIAISTQWTQPIPNTTMVCVIRDKFMRRLDISSCEVSSILKRKILLKVFIEKPAVYQIEITNSDGVALFADPMALSVAPKVVVSRVFPSSGPLRGGTIVFTVIENVLAFDYEWKCHFGDSLAFGAVVANSSVVSCKSPLRNETGSVAFGISLQNSPPIQSQQGFTYVPDDIVNEVVPSRIIITSSTAITLMGIHFVRNGYSEPNCRIGSVITGAIILSETEAMCEPIDMPQGTYSITIATDGMNYALTDRFVTYIARLRIFTINPPRAPANYVQNITVTGRGFESKKVLECSFGGSIKTNGSLVSPSEVSCPLPIVLTSLIVPLSIVFDSFVSNELVFEFEVPLFLLSTSPNFGFSRGGMPLIVEVSGLAANGVIWCEFGHLKARAKFVSKRELQCMTPRHLPGVVYVRLSGTQSSVQRSEVAFEFIGDLSVISALPARGPRAGGTNVLITLSDSVDYLDVQPICLFGTTKTIGTLVSSTEIVCTTPSADTGKVAIEILLNRKEIIAGTDINFHYYEPRELVSVVPKLGSVRGGTLLTLSIDELVPESTYTCAFSSKQTLISQAVVTSTMTITCVTPNMAQPGIVQLSVYSDGTPFSLNSVAYEFITDAKILSITPQLIPETGNGLVQVYGDEFLVHSPAVCRFGEGFAIRATVITSSMLECIAPAMALGNHTFSISWNEQEFVVADDHIFVHEQLSVEGFSPSYGSTAGSTEVTIQGSGFKNTSSLLCRFGTQIAMAAFMSRHEIVCLSPAVNVLQMESQYMQEGVPVAVSLDGIAFFASFSSRFYYIPPPQLTSIFPSSGSSLGGTNVIAIGSFQTSFAHSCVFGLISVPASVINTTTLSCLTPQVEWAQTNTMQIEVEGRNLASKSVLFRYFPHPVILSISPSVVSSSRREEIIITGTNFEPTNHIACRVGNQILTGNKVRFVSSDAIAITAPFHQAGFAIVDVSLNGIDFTGRTNVSLYFIDAMGTVKVFPKAVRASGGTKLNIELQQMDRASLFKCLFICESNTLTRPAFALNETVVTCFSPALRCSEISIGVLINQKTRVLSDLMLRVIADPHIEAMEPYRGPSTGNTVLHMYGRFPPNESLLCLFGSSESVEAHFANSSTVLCLTPNAQGRNATQVAVSVKEALALTSNSMTFSYDLPIEAYWSAPLRASSTGGISVVVRGSNFVNTSDLCCRFDHHVPTPAVYINSTSIACKLQAWKQESEFLGVSNNGHDFVQLQLTFESDIMIVALNPSRGPVQGGTEVILTFINAPNRNDQVFCSFGDVEVRFTYINQTSGKCLAPPVDNPSTVSVRVFWHTADMEERQEVQSSSEISFEFEIMPELLSLIPSSGSYFELTEIELIGSAFTDNMTALFGTGINAISAQVRVESPTKGMVSAPKYAVDYDGEAVTVVVSTNGLDYSNSLIFFYQPTALVKSVWPNEIIVNGTDSSVQVLIDGENFGELTRETIQCKIGDANPSKATWISSTQVSCIAPLLPAGQYLVQITLNGKDFTHNEVLLLYRESIVLYSVNPGFGSVHGGTQVHITGEHFNAVTSNADLYCYFGAEMIRAKILNDSVLVCESPPQESDGIVSVFVRQAISTISYEIGTASQTSLSFKYVQMPVIEWVFPLTIFRQDSPSIRLFGTKFLDTPLLKCQVGCIIVNARFHSSSLVECDLKLLNYSLVNLPTLAVGVSNNAQDFTNSEIDVNVEEKIQLLSIDPIKSTLNRMVIATLTGESFSRLQNLTCLIGENVIVNARFVSDQRIECILPAVSRAMAVQVAVSGNGVDYSSKTVRFEYVDAAIAFSISPAFGPFDGGTSVTIEGQGFDDSEQIYCVFGPSLSQARVLSPEMIECDSPPHSKGTASVVPISVQKYEMTSYTEFISSQLTRMTPSATDLTFAYVDVPTAMPFRGSAADEISVGLDDGSSIFNACVDCQAKEVESEAIDIPRILSLTPTSGSVTGGTNVTIYGQNFLSRPNLTCIFGAWESTAENKNASHLTCLTPPQNESGPVFVKLRAFGLERTTDDEVFRSSSVFHYHDPLTLHSFLPLHGPCTGGSELKVQGSGFLKTKEMSCLFRIFVAYRPDRVEISVPAQFHSPEQISCVVPTLERTIIVSSPNWQFNATATAQIEISNNGIDFTPTNKMFVYEPVLQLKTLNPIYGPLDGNSLVRVQHGKSVFNVTHCRFGDNPPVQATRLSADAVVCQSTPLSMRPTVLSIQLNSSSLAQEIQTITTVAATGSVCSGYFTLRHGSDVSDLIAYNAPSTGTNGDSVLELLSQLSSTFVDSVTRSGPDAQLGYTWTVTFSRSMGNVPLLHADSLLLAGVDSFVSVQTIQDGPAVSVNSEIQQVKLIQANIQFPVVSLRLGLLATASEVQVIQVSSSATISGSFVLSYLGFASLPASWDISAVSIVGLISALPGTGIVSATRNSVANYQGFTWSITFQTLVGSRPLLQLTTSSLASVSALTATVTRLAAGTNALGGSFMLGLTAGTVTSAISYDVSSDDLRAVFFQQLLLYPTKIQKYVLPTEIVWNATFALFDTIASGLLVSSSTFTGSSGLRILFDTAKGQRMAGTFSLTLDGVTTTALSAFTSAASVQQALRNLGLPATANVVVTQPTIANGTLYQLTFPDIVGNINPLMISASGLTGPGISSSVTTIQDGTYAPLGGSFRLQAGAKVSNSMTASPVVANSVLQTELQTLFSASITTITLTTINNGYSWIITFDSHVDEALLSTFSSRSQLTGPDAGLFLSAIDKGQGLAILVTLSSNGVDFASTPLTFTYLLPFEVVTMDPTTGPNDGWTPVTITLRTSFSYTTVFCRFGALIVQGLIIAPLSISCHSPTSLESGFVRVDIGVNGVDFDTHAGYFEYQADHSSRLQLTPLNGVVAGGTLVNIFGETFDLDRTYSCLFGNQRIAAEYVNQTHLGCRTPAVLVAGRVAVKISDNGVNFSAYNLSFTYEDPVFVTKIYPFSGDLEGGALVNIIGGSFVAGRKSSYCRFGDTVVDATVISTTMMQCLAPPLKLIQEVQMLRISRRSFIPDVQRVTISASPLQATVQEIQLSADPLVPEIQEFRIYGDDVPEIQLLTVSSQAFSGERFSIKTSVQSQVNEIQVVQMRASSFIGGSFRLALEGRETVTLASYATSSELAAALEQLENVGSVSVSKTISDSAGSCFWEIQFLARCGDVPMLSIRNLTLLDSGSHDLTLQVLEFVKGQGTPLLGSFQLLVDGSVSTLIQYDATADVMQSILNPVSGLGGHVTVTRNGPFINNAYEWIVTFSGYPDRVRTVSPVTSQLAGGSGIVSISLLSSGAKSEQQQVTTSQSSGSFICQLNGIGVSSSIPFDASANSFKSAFNFNSFGRLDVSGNAGGPWTVLFLDLVGSLNLLDCGTFQTTVRLVQGTGSNLSGVFRVGLNGQFCLVDLPYDVSATDLETELKQCLSIPDLTVSDVSPTRVGNNSWQVTFPSTQGDVAVLDTDGSGLQGEAPVVSSTEQQKGNEVAGRVQLSWRNRTSLLFATNAVSEVIEQALLPLDTSGIIVSATNSLSAFGMLLQITYPMDLGDVPMASIIIDNKNLAGSGVKLESSTIQNGSEPINGSFVLGYDGVETPPLAWNVSAEELSMTLRFLKTVPDADVGVTRTDPDSSGGMTWRITFPLGLSHRSALLVPLFANTLSGSNIRMSVRLITQETAHLGGNIQLRYLNQTTASIDVSASTAVIKAALMNLSTIGNISVSSLRRNNVVQWDIAFLSVRNSVVSSALLEIAQTNFTGGSAAATVERIQSASWNTVQGLKMYTAIAQSNANFTVSWNGIASTGVGNANMTASQFELLLQTIPGMGSIKVERFATTVGVGFTWTVLCLDLALTSQPQMTILLTNPAPADLVVQIQAYSPTVVPLAGSFKVNYGTSCSELTIGGYCTPAWTASLPYNIDAASFAHELSLLPSMNNVIVTQDPATVASLDYRWLITFPYAFGTVPLLAIDASVLTSSGLIVTVEELQKGVGLNGAQVALEVSFNGQDYTSSGVVYRYAPTPTVEQLTPNHGPLAGGTEVVVRGHNFLNTSSLRCQFGSIVFAAATFINSTHLTCIAPSSRALGDVFVEISNHGLYGNASYTTSQKIFSYDQEIVIRDVFPVQGPKKGNFSVLLDGGPFHTTDEIFCKFAEVAVQATWNSFDEILCMAPPHLPGTFPLEVTVNGQDYTDTGFPFFYYVEQGIHRIDPVFGPAVGAGTSVMVEGSGFVNSSYLTCRFGYLMSPGVFVSPSRMKCVTPPVSKYSGGLEAIPLSEHRNTYPDPSTGSVFLFPTAHFYPQYLTRLVTLEVSNNQQDFSLGGISFLYYKDTVLDAVYPSTAYDVPELSIFARGRNFINSTSLTCRLGRHVVNATFVSPELLLCVVRAAMPDKHNTSAYAIPRVAHTALVSVANNGQDFTSSRVVFEFLGSCPTGSYCPDELQGRKLDCPRGSFCPGVGNHNFTLCPRGTYQPQIAQAACLRCPIGYHCPHTGMHVPRVCPAGFVCDVTGIEDVEQPCPEGHFCLEGTATVSVTCTPLGYTAGILVSAIETEKLSTRRRRSDPAHSNYAVGVRKSGCWNNETSDFGLQLSSSSSRFWMELRQLPLSPESAFAPIRGRFCLDDSCLKLADANNFRVQDDNFDYSSTGFALRRPIACAPGSYCHPGTAGNDLTMKNFTLPQPCYESMYCPEGSASPMGAASCAPGFYCPFGTRISCPAGTYCPQSGLIAPVACPPGTFNGMIAQSACTPCPVGYICPGLDRIMPVICPAGFVCSKQNLSSPNSLCPRGFYCLEGTATSDGFRDDTRLRPYPCKPGTYCVKGVVSDIVMTGDYRHPQNCTEGFYCELGSFTATGSGLCPRGFICPSGTAVPIPTDAGTYADLEGMISAADCAPGFYAPTIESTECIPCPPGTSCENDGTAVASICQPGMYRGSLTADGISCLACPQGTWSKNWEIRGVEECIKCPPGSVCPIDGIMYPCTNGDLPGLYEPLSGNLTYTQCLNMGDSYFFGVLLEPWIDAEGGGPHFLPARNGSCFVNSKPRGSVLYQRLVDFHGPMYELKTGIPHQGYGDGSQSPVPSIFGRGSLVIDLDVAQMYDAARSCTKGFFYENQWFPGTCEADLFCASALFTSDEVVSQAQPCPEGYVCDLSTTSSTAMAHLCPAGYVCGPGTTPDLNLEAPLGQLAQLCPASYYCSEGTAESQKELNLCPAGYFCPTGTVNPYVGTMANDGLRRRLTANQVNPFAHMNYTKYIGDGDIRVISAHDMRCFNGIDSDLLRIFHGYERADGSHAVINRALENALTCARDHKWRHVNLAWRRNECDCVSQAALVQQVYQLWRCTVAPSKPKPTVYDRKMYGWETAHNPSKLCVFPSSSGSSSVNLEVALNSTGMLFQTSWVDEVYFFSYAELKAVVEADYKAQLSAIPSSSLQVDPYLYDLHYAISTIDVYGEDTIAMIAQADSAVLRLDTCSCPNMLKCPNGTISAVGSNDIYSCVKTGSEILQRLMPIPTAFDRLVNGTDFVELSGMDKGIGTIQLQPLEVAVLTINTTQLSRNLTYKDHYQISVYHDCKPCPPRYSCNLKTTPPSCTYPEGDNTTAIRLFDACMEEKGNANLCNAMPYYCEARTYAYLNADGSNTSVSADGCCSCERMEMPYYFTDTTADLGYADNKHKYLQFSITAVVAIEITVVLELLHGLYVQDFEEGFTEDRFDITIFTPSRADYAPTTPSTNAFFAVMEESTYDDLVLPLNLPESSQRVAGTTTYQRAFENYAFIDRMSDILLGDPGYPAKHGFARNTEQNSIGGVIVTVSMGNSSNATDNSSYIVAPTEYFGLYPIADALTDVLRADTWWSNVLNGTDTIALPYLPFFSNCRGFDSHIWIAKLLESHPDCEFVSYDSTVEVNEYPWKKKTIPNADKCIIDYNVGTASLERGITLPCLYEEDLEAGADKTRWYEASAGTVLFYLTRDPMSADDFVGTSSDDGWGRTATINGYVGSDNLIPVKGTY